MNDSSLPVFTIGVVADIIGVSVQTLRLWENKGLISPSRKGKDRYYSQDDLNKLRYVKHLLSEKKLNTYGVKEILEKEGWEHFSEGIEEEGAEAAEEALDEAAPEAPAVGDLAAKGNGGALHEQKRILVIDDDFDHVSAVKAVLESDNLEVLTALSGRDGLYKAKNDNPDMIILDVMIPDLDGIEICKELKALPEFKDVPICILSSIPEKMRDKFGIQTPDLPADHFAHKPIRPGKLLEVVHNLLG